MLTFSGLQLPFSVSLFPCMIVGKGHLQCCPYPSGPSHTNSHIVPIFQLLDLATYFNWVSPIIFDRFERGYRRKSKKNVFPRKGGAIEEDGYVAASHANICTSFLPAVYIHLKVLWGKAGGLFTVSVFNMDQYLLGAVHILRQPKTGVRRPPLPPRSAMVIFWLTPPPPLVSNCQHLDDPPSPPRQPLSSFA